jgi:hypothetical protein
MRNFILAFLLIGFYALPTVASDIPRKYIPDAQEVGKARLTYLFWDVYDATLYAPKGKWSEQAPHALTLSYLLELEGKKIAERSVEEMQKQGFKDKKKLADWQVQMEKIFPDVKKGSQLTAIFTLGQETRFYKNNRQFIGSVADPEFGVQFSNIWLSEKTSEPEMRKELLALK